MRVCLNLAIPHGWLGLNKPAKIASNNLLGNLKGVHRLRSRPTEDAADAA